MLEIVVDHSLVALAEDIRHRRYHLTLEIAVDHSFVVPVEDIRLVVEGIARAGPSGHDR